jgi:hypothetical protein
MLERICGIDATNCVIEVVSACATVMMRKTRTTTIAVYTRTVATTCGSPGMADAMRVTIGLMTKASSQARKNVSRMSPKKPIADAARSTATKNRTTVPSTRIALRRRRSRPPGTIASSIGR